MIRNRMKQSEANGKMKDIIIIMGKKSASPLPQNLLCLSLSSGSSSALWKIRRKTRSLDSRSARRSTELWRAGKSVRNSSNPRKPFDRPQTRDFTNLPPSGPSWSSGATGSAKSSPYSGARTVGRMRMVGGTGREMERNHRSVEREGKASKGRSMAWEKKDSRIRDCTADTCNSTAASFGRRGTTTYRG